MKSIVFSLLILFFFTCKNEVIQTNDRTFQTEIYKEILPTLVDSVYLNPDILANIPPNPYSKSYQYELVKWKSKQKVVELNFSVKYVLLDSILYQPKSDFKSIFHTKFPNEKLEMTNDTNQLVYVNLKQIKLHKSIIFLPKNPKTISKNIPAIQLSLIQLDVTKTFGMLEVNYFCGQNCGQNYVVSIEKVNQKWCIHSIELVSQI